MSAFDFFEEKNSDDPNPDEVVQRLERSLDFWVEGKEDYPPAIRGVMAEIHDLPADVQRLVQKIARDKRYPQLALKRLLWFEDKNEKLDEACSEAKSAFRPYAINKDGLVSTTDPNNPLLETPSRHRLIVSDQFAKTNYEQVGEDEFFLDDDDDDDLEELDDDDSNQQIGPNHWKRKITQTLKPWLIKKENNKIGCARTADDQLATMNALFSRTKHGWLVVDMFKLKKRRGAMLTYAKTVEYQKKGDQAYEFLVELFGAAAECNARLQKTLKNTGTLFLEISEDGEIYLTQASVYSESELAKIADSTARVEVPIEARVVTANGKPSQIVLKKSGAYYESKLAPLIAQGKRLKTKIDLKKSSSAEKHYCFHVLLELDGPLLTAKSGNAVLFQLDDLLSRFAKTNLKQIRASAEKDNEE
ncbi:MAG: hypothetical protein AAF939_15455 [Planctomycetota bacterium]